MLNSVQMQILALFVLWLGFALPIKAEIVGGVFTYVVKKGDSLLSIGARFGVEAEVLARANGIAKQDYLYVGQKLKIDNRHLVPVKRAEGILINIPQRMLYLFRAGRIVAYYPVALGRPSWPTPTGRFVILNKAVNKEWIVPQSVQEEMRREGHAVLTRVPPGPDNPLGKYWLGLSLPGYGIHSTIYPQSLYQFRTHGCIRLHPEDAEALFLETKEGDRVEIIYRPVIVERDAEGRVWLEVHRDVYRRGVDFWQEFLQAASSKKPLPQLNWNQVLLELKRKQGIAKRIDLRELEPERSGGGSDEQAAISQTGT
jgi:L,D-transpeptidase ErfK/SrfK